MRERWFMGAGVLILLVLVMVGCAQAEAPIISLTETRVTTDAGDQYDPAIWGDIVVFTDYRSADTDVYYRDLSNNLEFPVVVAPGNQELTDVSRGIIVYTDYRSADITAPDKITVGHPFNSVDPATDGTIVVWEDSRDGNMEIYAMDLGTHEERRISTNTDVDSRPAVSDGRIVWQRCQAGGTCDIYLYNWADETMQQITNTPLSNERNPDINGQNIVYQSDRDGNSDICTYHLDTGTEERLTLAGDQANPHVWGDNVAFDDLTSGLYYEKLWNMPSGSVFDLTGGASGHYLNSIWEDRVVYTDDRNGDLEIFMTGFTLTNPAPVPEFPSLFLPAASVLGFLCIVFSLRKTRGR
jgi:beta propeller repeat protein